MGRYLNVGLIQMEVNEETEKNLAYLEKMVDALMLKVHKPELVIGVEGAIGLKEPQKIPGPATDFLSRIARKHGIYFLPGSMAEMEEDKDISACYNAAPIFNPSGDIIDVYRKMCPWYPEEKFRAGTKYVVFDIPEKETKIGVQICYDSYFPEISRNLTLMGAEILVKLQLDPDPLYEPYKCLARTRAIENQAYFIATNGVGFHSGASVYGHSIVVDPEANILWEGERTPVICTITIDLDKVSNSRNYGAFFMDQTVKHLKYFNFPMPYADDIGSAPLFRTLKPPFNTEDEYKAGLRDFHERLNE